MSNCNTPVAGPAILLPDGWPAALLPCATPCSTESDLVFPMTLPAFRRRTRAASSISCSPFLKKCLGSPTYQGSPSRLQSILKFYTWRDVKGHLSEVIGRGGFGEVYKAHIHGFDLAIKKLRHNKMNKRTIMKSLQSERLALTLKHRNVVTTFLVNDSSDPGFIVMEYVGTHSLQHLIDSGEVKTERVRHFSHDLAHALNYIHSQKIVHLDVKPSNVLITSYHLGKLGDFGCSQKLYWGGSAESLSPTFRSDITGTVAYRAPELLRGSMPSVKADIYAYGILLWQMLSCKHPYMGKDNHMVIFAVVAQGLRPSVSGLDIDADDLIALCQQCWSADPDNRPDASSIIYTLEHICLDSDLHIRKALF